MIDHGLPVASTGLTRGEDGWLDRRSLAGGACMPQAAIWEFGRRCAQDRPTVWTEPGLQHWARCAFRRGWNRPSRRPAMLGDSMPSSFTRRRTDLSITYAASFFDPSGWFRSNDGMELSAFVLWSPIKRQVKTLESPKIEGFYFKN
jgi:hypothetical protein